MESPNKKHFVQTLEPAARPESLAVITGYEPEILSTALRIRRSIAAGHQIKAPLTRGLARARTEPNFGNGASLAGNAFEINVLIFSAGTRTNELQPFGSISEINSTSPRKHLLTTSGMKGPDGFDLDEVFGERKLNFNSSPLKKRERTEEEVIDEMEMDDTDVEDEEPIAPLPVKAFPKRNFGKTQSMPSLDFGASF